jgi:hypothetical protein
MYNILFIGRVSVFVMPCLFWVRQMFITLQPKKIQYDSLRGFMWKKWAKVDELRGIYIFFSKDTNEKIHCEEVQGINF